MKRIIYVGTQIDLAMMFEPDIEAEEESVEIEVETLMYGCNETD